ncbi:Toll-like receptor 11 [Frankliniella fusca]|uniref:Toll-like receptor 11 n=1 Tax=Frankliniella fusca TaxID=407009 RepID=A0AAE1HXN3_9NEOP|nr:Toll-like receptor 11 [Frankliniella fusca]
MAGALFGGEDLGQVEEVNFEECSVVCEHCGARYWKAELTRARNDVGLKCCTYGKFTLPQNGQFRRPPNEIVQLFTGQDERATQFQKNILKYNKLFATAFISGDFQNVGDRQHGLWSLKINGEVRWHNHAYCDPGDETRPPNHGQLYFLDYSNDNEEEITQQRLAGLQYNDGLDAQVMAQLERYLRENNPFIQAFKTAREVQEQEQNAARAEGRLMRDVVLVINPKARGTRVTRVGDGYVDRLLRGNEVAITPVADGIGAVFAGRLPPMRYDAQYFPRQQREDERPPGAPQVSTRTLDIQMFPLIHLHGEASHIDFTDGRDKTPSLAEYYRYRLGIRDVDFDILRMGKKLFAMYLLNGALRVLYEWLSFRATHQQTLKAEQYHALRRFVEQQAHLQGRRFGGIVILPRGIYGSQRHMKELFYDALAVSQKLGHPSAL